MDLVDALEILQIDKHEINSLTLEYLKKRYHKLALQNHPDKNGNTIASKETFQKINEAYGVLKREISIIDGSHEDDHIDDNDNNNNNNNDSSNNSQYYGYTYIVNLFIDGLLKGTYNEFISSIVKDIASGYTTISLKLFEDLDKERALSVYNFIFKYKSILHINDSILVKVRDIILEKYNDVQIYILNPSINDLINDNVYKLIIEKEVYYVPLWHNECYFDSSAGDIIVKCIPDFPSNITIDENNNLFVVHHVSFTFSLLNQDSIVVLIGNKPFDIPLNKLFCKMSQTYILKNIGVSQIIENDICNVDSRGDIIFNIVFE